MFSPHPDDETLGCGGTIAKKIDEGYEVLIVIMTDGRYAFSKVLGIDSDPTPEELKEMRKKEVERAANILGVPEKNLFFLDFEDGTLECNKKEAEKKITEILRKNPPTEIYFTYEKDANPDHRETNRILRKVINKMGLSATKYQYSISQTYLTRFGPMIDSFLNFFKRNRVCVDISKFLHLKEAALREFKSQIAMISSKQKKPIVSSQKIKRHLKNREVFYKDP